VTPLLLERAGPIWGPLGDEAKAALARMSVEQLQSLTDFFRFGIELNEKHVERVRRLEMD
jgi:hypothetical protein